MDDVFSSRSFESLGVSRPILNALEKMGFEKPTQAQAEMIPVAMNGKDVLGQSKTGTGKTAAFAIPMLQRVEPGDRFGGLVLAPTRELAIQVAHEMRNIARFTSHNIVPIYGGQPMRKQAVKLQKGPAIIVGTPGRVMDFHRRGQIPYDHVKVAVLDEVDRMLDIGFRDDIRAILGTMSHSHQTIFVSATISDEIDRLSRQYMTDPVPLNISASRSLTVEQVKQFYLSVQPWDKNRLLVYLLKHEEPALTLVFCRTKQRVDALARYIQKKGIDAHAIHGDMYQGKRNRVMRKLREGQLSVLIASDLASRGLDVDDITHVINFDVPEDPDLYVHRIGRTARAGRDGVAWSFITPEQGPLLSKIERLTNVEIPLFDYPGFKPGREPADVTAQRQAEEARVESQRAEHKRFAETPPSKDDASDATRFPGGVVPVAIPGKRMGGRLRTRRR